MQEHFSHKNFWSDLFVAEVMLTQIAAFVENNLKSVA